MKGIPFDGDRVIIKDGAMGTSLMRLGPASTDKPERMNLRRPEIVQGIHTEYLQAGCDIVTANTFNVNSFPDLKETESVIQAGIRCAREAANRFGRGWIAMDLGPTGKMPEPYGDMPYESAVCGFTRTAALGAESGADLILIETMTDMRELKAAVLGAKATGLPVVASFSVSQTGRLLSGADVQGTAAMLESLGVSAVGINCGHGPATLAPFAQTLLNCVSIPAMLCPNAGPPRMQEGHAVYDVTPEQFANEMKPLLRAGLRIAGGCCGTTPAHIQALKKASEGWRVAPARQQAPCWAASWRRSLNLAEGCSVIHPHTSRLSADADILCLSVDAPDAADAVADLQMEYAAPLLLTARNEAALVSAVRAYGGKPLLHLTGIGPYEAERVLAIMRQYGGVAVIDLAGENTASDEACLSMARDVLKEAKRFGVRAADILFKLPCRGETPYPDNLRAALPLIAALYKELNARSVWAPALSSSAFKRPEADPLFEQAVRAGLAAVWGEVS